MSIIELTTDKKELAKVLIERAKAHRTITFGEVEALTGINRHRVSIAGMVISYKCKELNLPLLSVLIVYSDTKKIETGFAREFFEDEFYKGHNQEIIDENIQKVFACEDWSRLEECLT